MGVGRVDNGCRKQWMTSDPVAGAGAVCQTLAAEVSEHVQTMAIASTVSRMLIQYQLQLQGETASGAAQVDS